MKFDLSKIRDYHYYSTKLLKIQTEMGLESFDYTTRYVQKQIDTEWKKCIANNEPVKFIILKARRHGVSTYVQSRMFHGCHTNSHRQAITIAADDDGCEYIHGMSQVYYDYLPPELQPALKQKNISKMVFDYPKTKTQKEGVNYGLKSTLKTVSCNNRAGLGTGNHFIHFSEYAMYRDAEGVRKSVMPTSFDVPGTFVIIESTANGMVGNGEAFHTEWTNAKQGKSIFKPLFYSWLKHEHYRRPRVGTILKKDKEKILDSITLEERNLMDVHKVTLEQLNWRRYTIIGLGDQGGADKDGLQGFHEQYPTTDTEAFIVTGRSVFNGEILKLYKNQVKPPIEKADIVSGKIRKNCDGELWIWKQPVKGAEYVASIDPASGEPGATDFGCVEVFRVGEISKGDYGEQVAEWHGKTDSDELAKIAITIGNYYNHALLAPEIFGYGHAVLGGLLRGDYPNILRRTQLDAITKTYLKKHGWKTDPTTKPAMLTLGRYIVNNKMVRIYSEPLIDEMIMFTRDAGGSGASAYGRGKDDRCMAFLIVLKAIEQEFADTDMNAVGVEQPKDQEHTTAEKRDKLHYDSFWDDNPGGRPRSKSWLDL